VVALALAMACGPAVGPSDSSESSSGGSGEGSTLASGVTSTFGMDASDGAGTTSSDSTTGEPTGTTPMYGACTGTEQCLPDLLCAPISTPTGGSSGSICTAECSTPAIDCVPPPAGWEAVCNGFFHEIPPDPFCAIGCDAELGCPEGMICGTGIPFTEPYYCVQQ